MNRILIIVLFFLPSTLLAQVEKQAKLPNSEIVRPTPFLLSDTIESDKLFVVEYRNLKQLILPKVVLSNIQYKEIIERQKDKSLSLPEKVEATVRVTMERKVPKAVIYIPRYIRKADGRVYRVEHADIQLEESSIQQKTTGARVYANESVLSSGNFYKIAVSAQGIYKIDYNYLINTFGIDPSAINPANIRVFGNGGEMIAEDNAIPRADDLIENAIKVVDGNDGQFNPGDYFLFYANGPHAIVKDSLKKSFYHLSNIYSDLSFYFICFDKGVGKRIANGNNPSSANVNVVSYNDVMFTEKDSSNLGKFGKSWWGDEFSEQPGRYLNRSYNFDIPAIDLSTPIAIRTKFGAVSYSSSTSFNVYANGQYLHASSLPLVGSTYADSVIETADLTTPFTMNSTALQVELRFNKSGNSSAGYLDFIEVNARRFLQFNGYLNFADWNSVAPGNVANFQISNATSSMFVWDITNPLEPVQMNTQLVGTTANFIMDASVLRRYVANDGSLVMIPSYIEKTPNQNLHQYIAKDYFIISHPLLKPEAERLAAHHMAKRGLRTSIITPQEIYNEFASGAQDVSAIRDFLKMVYDKASLADIPKYVLFMGDASYDYKNRIKNNTNLVPTFQTNESNDKIYGYCTDDFFGFLDDNENINNFNGVHVNTLDIGIGRIPVSSLAKASDVVTKIIHYDSPASFGPWKNNMTFNADDGDGGGHLVDGEVMSQFVNDSLPNYNNYKIYVDGYNEESTPAGPRTPEANKAVNNQLFNGTFLMNYNGHGGPVGWCEERIFSMTDINQLTNYNKLPLFITATCDFAPFDDPAIVSAGEVLLNKPDGGAIALMTTTRLVYQDQNRTMNLNYMASGFRPMSNGQFPALGDAYRLSKNLRYVTYIDPFSASNFRKFALLGDPALPLAFPTYAIKTDSVNGVSISIALDTLKALGKYTISGHVADKQGNLLSNFNGIVYPVIFDKPKKLSTLQNGNDNPKKEYFVQNNILFKGKASVQNGKFSFTFVVPKDINYQIDKGKISYYADNTIEDASGHDKTIYIGGSNPNAIADNAGPIIKSYLNDEKFVNGGITTTNSTLLLKLSDDNGINYTGNSVGHDITASLDGNPQNTYILNNFFESSLDNYKEGSIRFPLNNLTEGPHTLFIKAWDISNNSSEAKLDFVVVSNDKGQLNHVYNYPNPFTTKTKFMFEHNMPGQNLSVLIHIYSATGKTVKTIRSVINTEGTRSDEIEWDGLDEFGDKIGKGVYVYKLSVKSANGFSDSKYQKLILLN